MGACNILDPLQTLLQAGLSFLLIPFPCSLEHLARKAEAETVQGVAASTSTEDGLTIAVSSADPEDIEVRGGGFCSIVMRFHTLARSTAVGVVPQPWRSWLPCLPHYHSTSRRRTCCRSSSRSSRWCARRGRTGFPYLQDARGLLDDGPQLAGDAGTACVQVALQRALRLANKMALLRKQDPPAPERPTSMSCIAGDEAEAGRPGAGDQAGISGRAAVMTQPDVFSFAGRARACLSLPLIV